MSKDILYLGSQSTSRKELLVNAGITVELLDHRSDEMLDFSQHEFHDAVQLIARSKMDSLILPAFQEALMGNKSPIYYYVVTADTLTRDTITGEILGKPTDKEAAKKMLDRQGPVEVATGCCVRKYLVNEHGFEIVYEKTWTTGAIIEFHVPEAYKEHYFSLMPQALYACGAGVVEGAGFLFLKSVKGCFSSVIGLPLYELRLALEACGFRFF